MSRKWLAVGCVKDYLGRYNKDIGPARLPRPSHQGSETEDGIEPSHSLIAGALSPPFLFGWLVAAAVLLAVAAHGVGVAVPKPGGGQSPQSFSTIASNDAPVLTPGSAE